MSILPDREKPPVETPGIVSYEIFSYEIGARPPARRIGLLLDLSDKFNKIDQISRALGMLEKKANNSFIQEAEFYLPEKMTISWEATIDRDAFETNKEVVRRTIHSKKHRDEHGYLFGYETTFEKINGQRGFRAVKFLPNGVKIVLSATKPRKGLLSRWSPVSAEVSVGISKRLSEQEAREHLEAFAHALY